MQSACSQVFLSCLHNAIFSCRCLHELRGLPDIPFHASPLIYGKDQYDGLDLATRKRLLASFFVLTRKLPIRYKTLAYRRYEVATLDRLIARIRCDLVVFISDNLDFFKSYENINTFYDNGQRTASGS